MEKYYAHSKENEPPENWQELHVHLHSVARLAADFAKPFGGDEWAFLAGLWHDLGKYNPAFQKKLYDAHGIEAHIETVPGRVVHSEAGAHLATLKEWKGTDRLLAWLIMGHHAGLADYASEKTGAAALEVRMRNPERSHAILQNIPQEMLNQKRPTQSPPRGASVSFFIRMLFSCVVDADFLDTEAFMTPKNAALRAKYPELNELKPLFDRFIDEKCRNAPPTPVNQIRKEVLEHCLAAATEKTGEKSVFSLTVPTGGGKTLSSLAFALQHAVQHGQKRIIYVIPYTSIIEQTAAVFRTIPGFANAVLEHHSTVQNDEETAENHRSRLAAENWDAPIIVTTSVQFFESLFSAKTSRCRKLHNLVNSVIIFDEAQCLPPRFLRPCTFAIRELFRHYGVTPLLCTATQPVLTQTKQFDFNFAEGFENVHEIIPDPNALAERLKRVEIELFPDFPAKTTLEDLKNALSSEKTSVLCILNRKKDARILAQALPDEKTLHLSTNMCSKHRFSVLEAIKSRLKDEKEPLFVISTSLVEAGVDLDFPVVYRALAGLDSIAQAAGRCNREGKRPEKGKTIVFLPENQPNYVKQPAQIASEVLSGDLSTLFSPKIIEQYFKKRFWLLGEEELDHFDILSRLANGQNSYFRSVSDDFQLIQDEWTRPVIAPYDDAPRIIDEMLEAPWNMRSNLRKLQSYTINIDEKLFKQMLTREDIHPVKGLPELHLLNPLFYNDKYGFIPPDEAGSIDPEKKYHLIYHMVFRMVFRMNRRKTMDAIISMQDIRTTLGSIVKRAERGESFTVIKNSKPAFRIVPLETNTYTQTESGPPLTLREIRSRFDAHPITQDELTPEDLDRIIHEAHGK